MESGVENDFQGAWMTEILVVDDSKVMREMIVACLRGENFSFTHAASGLEAIEQMALRHFHLVVLDLNMPDIGGYEVIEFIRSQDKLQHLPILVVTTRGDEGSRTRALGVGASKFMTKPFAPEDILRSVRALLQQSSVSSEA
jgi:two-component system, chemotaxis family, chemotaxis protein CheY